MVNDDERAEDAPRYDPSSKATNTAATRTARRAAFAHGMSALTSGRTPTRKVTPGGPGTLSVSYGSRNRANPGRKLG